MIKLEMSNQQKRDGLLDVARTLNELGYSGPAFLLATIAEDYRNPTPESVPVSRICDAIGPHHGDRCNGGKVQSPNAQFTRDCQVCGGTGLVTTIAAESCDK
jgi:hypothetical protein